ncbi:MAG: hypothetical protein ACE37K_09120 [Planctomycetota bacterium]
MNTLTKTLSAFAACAVMTACGSVPKKTFVFDAITLEERAHPCLIVIDDEWDKAAENNQVVNMNGDDELKVTVEFRASEIEVTVAPLAPGSNVMPRSRSEAIQMSQFMDDMPRRLRMDDPAKHLFVLQPK